MDKPRCSVYFVKRNASKDTFLGRNKNLIGINIPNTMIKPVVETKESIKNPNYNTSGSSFTNTILRERINLTVDSNEEILEDQIEDLNFHTSKFSPKNAVDYIKQIHNLRNSMNTEDQRYSSSKANAQNIRSILFEKELVSKTAVKSNGNRGYDREDKKNSIFDPEPIASFREENFKTNKSGKVDEKLKISKSSKFRLTLNRVNRSSTTKLPFKQPDIYK